MNNRERYAWKRVTQQVPYTNISYHNKQIPIGVILLDKSPYTNTYLFENDGLVLYLDEDSCRVPGQPWKDSYINFTNNLGDSLPIIDIDGASDEVLYHLNGVILDSNFNPLLQVLKYRASPSGHGRYDIFISKKFYLAKSNITKFCNSLFKSGVVENIYFVENFPYYKNLINSATNKKLDNAWLKEHFNDLLL